MTGSERILVVEGDLTEQDADAIVNAANTTLLGGGGVDGAIHRAAGPELLEECRALGGAATGEAKVTRGHRLRARYVIHTPGPIWRGGAQGEPRLLRRCYREVFLRASEIGARTVALPAISTGVYRYPLAAATAIAVAEARRALAEGLVEEVRFICFTRPAAEAYRRELASSAD